MPMSMLKAEMIMMTGMVKPRPVRASAPTPGMLPMNTRSTMEYRAFTSWAAMAGRDSRSSSRGTGAWASCRDISV